MRVADAMTSPVVTVPADASLRKAADRICEEDIGSVVVTRDGNPAGILTERDFVAAGREYDRAFGEIPVYAAASGPLVTVRPDASLRKAAREMSEAGVKRLPVADGIDLVGILTASDLVGVGESLDSAAKRYVQEREDWLS
ncbi:CBS domain-containing protein [Halobacterium litoreum]|uniref:CBS domain-containing protein n=1 Tax=Halobacterium litoreum TaxID=2039234 RepID=A0ABD5NEW8_9EURY|nr:CBS domain-containing protein [Halobacterium litoreum]UHH13712.1 CBS domain-containing protein [Halobacterium litoreum]